MRKTFGHHLKFARIKLGLTQNQLAQKLDVAASTIGMYEQSRRIPDYDTLLKLCGILKISIYDIFLENRVFNADVALNYLINYLNTEKPVAWDGKVLDTEKKHSIANMLRLLVKEG